MSHGKVAIDNTTLIVVAFAAAKAMRTNGAFTRRGLSYDAEGNTASVWSDQAVQRCALGWVLKTSYDFLRLTEKRTQPAYRIAQLISEHVAVLTGCTLVQLGDDVGAEAAAEALFRVGLQLAKDEGW